MRLRVCRTLALAGASAIVAIASPSFGQMATAPSSQAASKPAPLPRLEARADDPIPVIPLDRIEFRGTGYPIIPPDVQQLIDLREDIWELKDRAAFQRAMPEVERWEKLGRPFVRVAAQPSDLPKGDVPAFPGAEGGGMYTIGGRGGRVYVVTSLADSGPGTLREACEAGGARTVVFNVAGIIRLERPLSIYAPYLTIAGQTAPGDGVCIAGQSVHVRTHDVILRHLRVRRGITDISSRDDALSGDAIGNIVLDHVSASWGNDETLSFYRQMYAADPSKPRERRKMQTVNNTIQWSIISESLDTYHHGFGATWGGLNTGFHHNLFACNRGRNPSISAADFNFANNVLFNWEHRTLDGGARTINVINNYFKPGPRTKGALRYRVGKPEGGSWYAAGNFVEGNPEVTADNWAGGIQGEGGAGPRGRRRDEAGEIPHMTITSAQEAYAAVLADAGATLPKRDPVDARVVEMVRTGEVTYKENAGIITDIAQVGGYPEYKGTPHVYPQNDGIPDAWKTKHGLDLTDAALAAKDADGDGYTTLEEYLNGTDPTRAVDYKDLKNNVDALGK